MAPSCVPVWRTRLVSQQERRRPSRRPHRDDEGLDAGTDACLSAGMVAEPTTCIRTNADGADVWDATGLRHGLCGPTPARSPPAGGSVAVAQGAGFDVEEDVVRGRGGHLATAPCREHGVAFGLARPCEQPAQLSIGSFTSGATVDQIAHLTAIGQPASVLGEDGVTYLRVDVVD